MWATLGEPFRGPKEEDHFLDDQLPQPAVAGIALILPPPDHVEGEFAVGDRRRGRRQTSWRAIMLGPLLRQQRSEIAIFQYRKHRRQAGYRYRDPARQPL